MSYSSFPALPSGEKQDSTKYSTSQEDVAMKTDMEGGYQVSRAKFTRAPRRTFKSGFTAIDNADKIALENFYASVKGGSSIFMWTDPVNSVEYFVRFEGGLDFAYKGMGNRHLWDVSFSLMEA